MRYSMIIATLAATLLSAGCSIRIDVDEGRRDPFVSYAADHTRRSAVRVASVSGTQNKWSERYFIERSHGQTVLRVDTDVKPAWLGVYFRDIGRSSARKLGVERHSGLYVRRVVRGSPAAESGLQAKDILVSVDGLPVPRVRDFRRIVREVVAPGQLVTMRVLRGPRGAKQEYAIAVCMGETEDDKHVSRQRMPLEHAYTGGDVRLGVLFATVPSDWAARMYDAPESAVVVGDVLRGSPAYAAGLRRGDRVMAVDGVPVTAADDAKAAVQTNRDADQQIEVLIERRPGHQALIHVSPPSRGWESWEAVDPRWNAAPAGRELDDEGSAVHSRSRWV